MKKRGAKYIAREIFLVFAYVFLMILGVALAAFAYLMIKTPLGNSLYTRDISQTSVIYDRTGSHVLYEIHGEENRKIVSHDQIPNYVREATIAAEDDSFYTHHGLDFLSIFRAVKNDVQTDSLEQGGSTITQQLARSAFLSRDKNFDRKIMEAVYAVKIERKYSKDQILDAYLNQVPYGSNSYGVETASETYFGKPAIDLSLDEAALLAALTRAPSYYSPYITSHNSELVARQKEILNRIGSLNIESPQAVMQALQVDTLQKIVPETAPIAAPHFVFYVKNILEKQYGKLLLETGGLKIYTTLDWNKQQLAEQTIQNSGNLLKNYGASNAAIVVLDPKTGQILAMVGSYNYYDPQIDGQVNVATSPRQPGSSFKPIVYAAAFEKGFQPETLVLDAPTNFGPDGSGHDYIPKNYDGNFHGVLTIRQALAMSLNIPAIKTLREVGLDNAIAMAHRLGITTLSDQNRYGLSLAIGGGEVTLLDETAAFSVFANDGQKNSPDPILKIVDDKGNTIKTNNSQNSQVLDSQVARKINSILSDNTARTPIFGPNNKLHIAGFNVAAKTGTTQDNHDAWTVGYTPDIAVGVWAGNSDNRAMRSGADGSYVAAPIWNQFMTQALPSYPNDAFVAYDNSSANNPPPTANFSLSNTEVKTKYFRISSGKEISADKAKKMDPSNVRLETQYTTLNPDGSQNVASTDTSGFQNNNPSSGQPVY